MPKIDETRPFIAARIAVMTISDTRSLADDKSGDTLVERLTAAGHILVDRAIVKDDKPSIRAQVETWVASDDVQVILTTGGTGITGRDVTPEVVEALYTKAIPGFGELFRMLSYETIGTSTIQSRATGGLVGTTLVFALPGSTGACRDAWDKILVTQLDNRYRPCNFIELMPRFSER
ncbi:MAG: molybdenum cofactor biosynthesis protein B [Alphaproteobacteria bacterium]|nr:MAG: molybdenum cofactor biosynthesis protein B [Alphaproteobacteria bacterium]